MSSDPITILQRQVSTLTSALDSGWFSNNEDVQAYLDDLEGNYYLLAHAIDGVIWGKVENGNWIMTTVEPSCRLETLQELRLFNKHEEIYIWRTGREWRCRRIADNEGSQSCDVIQEHHILWGTKGELTKDGFTVLTDGSQGLRHVLPIDASKVNEKNIRPALRVHHYLQIDEATSVTYIAYTRLVGIEVVTDGK